jgi:hypothetical protein
MRSLFMNGLRIREANSKLRAKSRLIVGYMNRVRETYTYEPCQMLNPNKGDYV